MKTFLVSLVGHENPIKIQADYQVSDGSGTRLYVKDGEERNPMTDNQVASFYSGQVLSCYPEESE